MKAYDATHSDGMNLVNDPDNGESDQYKAVLDAIDKKEEAFEDFVRDLAGEVRDIGVAIKNVIP